MRIYDFRMDEILLLVTTEKVNYILSINQIIQEDFDYTTTAIFSIKYISRELLGRI